MEIIKFTEQQRKDYEQLPTGMAIYQIIDGKAKTLLVTDELCRLLRISREDLIVNLDKSVFGFGHPDDIGRMAYFGKNFAAHTDEKYDVFFRWKTPKMEDYHIFHSWANHVLVDGVSLGFFFYSDMEESGKNNQILDTHYQKYANDQDVPGTVDQPAQPPFPGNFRHGRSGQAAFSQEAAGLHDSQYCRHESLQQPLWLEKG
ncbi:PAS domain-containing protein [Lactobacillus delbrueckii]|uniref:PAS domain-containing protein n=1 Tax=Lactobacillus delbrueckii TaxID=1584 RepID=UPI0021A29074|nr:PAS domain-containing protein [Lactobacillus delbrueckii]